MWMWIMKFIKLQKKKEKKTKKTAQKTNNNNNNNNKNGYIELDPLSKFLSSDFHNLWRGLR